MMRRTIYCTYLKREAEGQDYQIYPNELGKRIYENISKEAWAQWQKQQTMLINKKKLSMLKLADRTVLEQAMLKFLFEDQAVHILDS